MHTERLLQSIRVPSLVLIVQALFLLERGQTDRQTHRQTRLYALPTPAAMPTWVITKLITLDQIKHKIALAVLFCIYN